MTYEELLTAARKGPHCVWIDEGSVSEIAECFRQMSFRPTEPVAALEAGIRGGTMKVYGVQIRVHGGPAKANAH